MAILIFILSLILLIGAAASGYQSLNLLPTGIGVLYALAGAAAACAAVLTFAIAILIRRIDALTRLVRQSAQAPADLAGLEMARVSETAPAGEVSAAPLAAEEEAPRALTRRPPRRTRARSTSIAPGICPRSRRARPFRRARSRRGRRA